MQTVPLRPSESRQPPTPFPVTEQSRTRPAVSVSAAPSFDAEPPVSVTPASSAPSCETVATRSPDAVFRSMTSAAFVVVLVTVSALSIVNGEVWG